MEHGVDMNESQSGEDGLDLTPADVIRLRQGDPDAAALLDRLYRERLLRFCWGYLSRMDEAEDAVQDIWHKVLQASEVPNRFRAWVYRIARNHCNNLVRNRKRRKDQAALPPASEIGDALTGQLTRLLKHEDLSRLRTMVESLSEAHREVLRLRYVENLGYSEIAMVLDIPKSVAKSRVFEGMKKLREQADLLEQS